MIMMAVPLMILYEVGILGGTFLTRRKKKSEAAAASKTSDASE